MDENSNGKAPNIDQRDAKQGITGQKVRYVLIGGMVLAVIAWILVSMFIN
jgi:hypothetical protein